MTARQIIVVDTETTGLDSTRHIVVEVAWHNLTTGEHGEFIPVHHRGEALAQAEIEALQINRYIDRLADPELQDTTWDEAARLQAQLHGNVLAGSNPAFEARFLPVMFEQQYLHVNDGVEMGTPSWHHRLLDLSAYAAGVLDLDPTELPGLARVAELCGVEHRDPHTATGDRDATVACFRVLMAHRAEKRAGVA